MNSNKVSIIISYLSLATLTILTTVLIFINREYTVSGIDTIFTIVSILCFISFANVHLSILFFQKELQEKHLQLMQASKLTAIGEMATSIAHEINNPLTVIKATATQLETEKDPSRNAKRISRIISSSCRIERIVNSIRKIARKSEKDPFVILSLKEIVKEVLDFSTLRFKNNSIDFSCTELPENLKISCRDIQIEQIIINLLNNAFDSVFSEKLRWVKIEYKIKEQDIELIFSNSGNSIPHHIQKQMKEPFYTPKDPGKKIGLGLSISQKIALEHNGALTYDSTSPHPTFILRLPLTEKFEALCQNC